MLCWKEGEKASANQPKLYQNAGGICIYVCVWLKSNHNTLHEIHHSSKKDAVAVILFLGFLKAAV